MEVLLDPLLASFQESPKALLLFAVAVANIVWVCRRVFQGQRLRQKIHRAYFAYAVLVLLWVMDNAYFQSKFLPALGPEVAEFMARFANVVSFSAILCFFYIASLLRSRDGRVSRWVWVVIGVLGAEELLMNVIPGLTVQEVLIFPDETFQIVFSPWNDLFFWSAVALIVLGMLQFLLAIRRRRNGIEQVQFFYTLFGMSLMYSAVIAFHVVLPLFFQNFRWVWVPPLMSICDVLIVGYGIYTKRFPDLRHHLRNGGRHLVALLLALPLGYCFLVLVEHLHLASTRLSRPVLVVGALGVAVLAYRQILRLLDSPRVRQVLGWTSVERFGKTVRVFMSRKKHYRSHRELQSALEKVFREELGIAGARIVSLQADDFPALHAHFSQQQECLVSKELQLLEAQEDRHFAYGSELRELGEVCCPLYQNGRTSSLIGLFVLGKKSGDRLYSREELRLLEPLSHYLSLTLLGIVYQSRLQEDVAAKTRDLKAMLQHQADFVSMTTHELRTPLSAALFECEDLVDTLPQNAEGHDEALTAYKSLERLRDRAEKIFAVQEYELGDVPLETEEVPIGELLASAAVEVAPVFQGQGVALVVRDQLPADARFRVDPAQIQKLLGELLTNAATFTPEDGQVVISAEQEGGDLVVRVVDGGPGIPDEKKAEIFEKFTGKGAVLGQGIGLGLYLCRCIAELHHGSIRVEDTPGGGATFVVTLPANG